MSHKAFYSKFFTPPRFLQLASVAIEILENGIYFLTVKRTSYGLIVDRAGFVPLLPGDIVRGEIVKKEAVIKALVNIRKKTGVNFVKFSIPEEQTYIFKTHLPDLKPSEIHDILDFKLEENIPLSSKEAVFDYDLVKIPGDRNGLDLVVAAAPLKIVEDLQAMFQSAGLTPVFFSPESNNVAKAVVKAGNEQVLSVVNIRDKKIIMSLVVSGTVYQTSSISFGGSNFTDLIAKSYKVTFAEAEQIKNTKLYCDGADNIETFSLIVNSLSAVKDEVSKFIAYCNEREDLPGKVDRVILCGRDAMIIGLTRYLSSGLGLPVEVANVWSNNFKLDEYVPDLNRLDSLDYAVVNGLHLF